MRRRNVFWNLFAVMTGIARRRNDSNGVTDFLINIAKGQM